MTELFNQWLLKNLQSKIVKGRVLCQKELGMPWSITYIIYFDLHFLLPCHGLVWSITMIIFLVGVNKEI